MLHLYRRHLASCGRTKRRTDCSCPVWVQGKLGEREIRKSLGIRNWSAAQKMVRDWEASPSEMVLVRDALTRFVSDCAARNVGDAQMGKYRLLEREMVDQFAERAIGSISTDELAEYRESWKLSPISAQKKLERLRTFFRFCVSRGWCSRNSAEGIKLPKFQRRQVEPFSEDEMQKIMEALNKYPDSPPGRRVQVRAFVLMLRYTGLRIGDVVSMHSSSIEAGSVRKQTHKTGAVVRLPLHDSVHDAIKELGRGTFFFWSGNGLIKSAVADWQRSLARLFELAGISHGHAHRFRHSLAVKLLSKGVAVNHVAAILGNSPAVVEKHYSAWIESRQAALNEAVRATF